MSTKPSEMSGEELVQALDKATRAEAPGCGIACIDRHASAKELFAEVASRLKQLDAVRQQRDAWRRACEHVTWEPVGVEPDSVAEARRLEQEP